MALLCFRSLKKTFVTVKPLKLDWDGMDGPLIASANNNYSSSKDGSMESLELADLRNPTQDMQRFRSQSRQWYCRLLFSIWYSHSSIFHLIFPFFYFPSDIPILLFSIWYFHFSIFHLIFPFFYFPSDIPILLFSIWYSHSSSRGSSPLPVVVTGPMDWGKLEWMMVTTDNDFDHIWWLTIRIDEKWLQVWCLCQAHLQGSHSYCQCRWPVSSISLTFL